MLVRYYAGQTGRVPVLDYLRELPSERREEVLAAIRDLERNGIEDSGATMRHVTGKLWEPKFSIDRVFYVVVTGPEMVLLHAFKKQGQKAPKREIETATRRMDDLFRR